VRRQRVESVKESLFGNHLESTCEINGESLIMGVAKRKKKRRKRNRERVRNKAGVSCAYRWFACV
jgi:hypothetical protein